MADYRLVHVARAACPSTDRTTRFDGVLCVLKFSGIFMLQTLLRSSGCSRGSYARVMVVVGALIGASATQAQVAHDHSPILTATNTAGAAASISAPPLTFESTLSRYKPMTDQKLGSWRDANDTVTRIGGWRTYLKEAQMPDAKTTTPAVAPATPAAANPHAGHGVKR